MSTKIIQADGSRENKFFTNLAAMTDNVFKQQRRNAFYASAKAVTVSAFGELGL